MKHAPQHIFLIAPDPLRPQAATLRSLRQFSGRILIRPVTPCAALRLLHATPCRDFAYGRDCPGATLLAAAILIEAGLPPARAAEPVRDFARRFIHPIRCGDRHTLNAATIHDWLLTRARSMPTIHCV